MRQKERNWRTIESLNFNKIFVHLVCAHKISAICIFLEFKKCLLQLNGKWNEFFSSSTKFTCFIKRHLHFWRCLIQLLFIYFVENGIECNGIVYTLHVKAHFKMEPNTMDKISCCTKYNYNYSSNNYK